MSPSEQARADALHRAAYRGAVAGQYMALGWPESAYVMAKMAAAAAFRAVPGLRKP